MCEGDSFDEGLNRDMKCRSDREESIDLGLVDVLAALLKLLNCSDGDIGEVRKFALAEIGLCAQALEVAFRMRFSI